MIPFLLSLFVLGAALPLLRWAMTAPIDAVSYRWLRDYWRTAGRPDGL